MSRNNTGIIRHKLRFFNCKVLHIRKKETVLWLDGKKIMLYNIENPDIVF